MKFQLDLLQNSHDYINNSFELYKIANEYGMHDKQRAIFENKIKWKLAFVTMVQAFELLLKEALYRVHPNLIYQDIDSERIAERNTITFSQAIMRINNFAGYAFGTEKKIFLLSCSKLRNEFIHSKVNIQSEQIMSKYCKLYSLYKEIHTKLIGDDIKFYTDNHKSTEQEILQSAKSWTVFRGREIHMDDLNELKKEIEENGTYKYCVNKEGRKVERIRYGDEINRVNIDKGYDLTFYSYYEICDDCNAKKGEFHLQNCDLEICPFCFGQLLTCGCVDYMESDKEE